MELRDEFEIVGDVRGKGLMLALEFVENKVCGNILSLCVCAYSIPVAPPSQYLLPRPPQATRKPLAAAEVNEIFELTKENGILVGKGGLYGSVRKTTLNI